MKNPCFFATFASSSIASATSVSSCSFLSANLPTLLSVRELFRSRSLAIKNRTRGSSWLGVFCGANCQTHVAKPIPRANQRGDKQREGLPEKSGVTVQSSGNGCQESCGHQA